MNWPVWLGSFDLWQVGISGSLALAVTATLGYVMGRRSRTDPEEPADRSRKELRRAQSVARELEKTSAKVRDHLARQRANLARFKRRIVELNGQQEDTAWRDLCRELEQFLDPTLQLATQIAGVYDRIRQQTNDMMTFTEARTDPLTGAGNRRGLEDCLRTQFALLHRYQTPFSVAVIEIGDLGPDGGEEGRLQRDCLLRRVAGFLDGTARETDYMACLGKETFVVVLPQTDLDGAGPCVLRLLAEIEKQLPITVSAAVASAEEIDTAESLLARADSALCAARSAGGNCVHRHTGTEVEAVPDLEALPTR